MVDTNDRIVSRTGIRERRVVDNGQTLSDMGSEIKQICQKRGISPLEIDMVIVGTVTVGSQVSKYIQHNMR